jgi:RNA polymerase sigma factor (sigma-70 family)
MESWVTENSWWREMATKMVGKSTTEMDWREANRRVWCLSFVASRSFEVDADGRRDLIQDILLRLQNAHIADLVAKAHAPAHYIAKMMRNLLKEQAARQRKSEHSAWRHAEAVRRFQLQPDEEASRKEQAEKANHVVNRVLSCSDRQLLVWYYFKHLSAAQIAARLEISEVTVWQRLVRARNRCKKALEQ